MQDRRTPGNEGKALGGIPETRGLDPHHVFANGGAREFKLTLGVGHCRFRPRGRAVMNRDLRAFNRAMLGVVDDTSDVAENRSARGPWREQKNKGGKR